MAKVRDIMQKNVITIESVKKAHDAAIILKEKEISFLVVVKEGKPIGIVSERDIVRKIVADNNDAQTTQLEIIMSKNFKWVEPNASIESAVQKMLNNSIRRLVVLENENLAGVITQTDLTEFLRSKILINATVENIETVTLKKVKDPSMDPDSKLKDAESKDRSKCELFIVEWDSAWGWIEEMRNSQFEAVYKLKWKPLSAQTNTADEIFKNKELKNLITEVRRITEKEVTSNWLEKITSIKTEMEVIIEEMFLVASRFWDWIREETGNWYPTVLDINIFVTPLYGEDLKENYENLIRNEEKIKKEGEEIFDKWIEINSPFVKELEKIVEENNLKDFVDKEIFEEFEEIKGNYENVEEWKKQEMKLFLYFLEEEKDYREERANASSWPGADFSKGYRH